MFPMFLCGEKRVFLIRNDRPVSIRPSIPVKLPGVTDLFDLVHIEVGHDKLVLVAGADGDHLTAGVTKIALPVKFTDVPRSFGADAINCPDKVAVSGGVSGLLELPKIFGQSGNGGRWIEDNLGAVQAKTARAF